MTPQPLYDEARICLPRSKESETREGDFFRLRCWLASASSSPVFWHEVWSGFMGSSRCLRAVRQGLAP